MVSMVSIYHVIMGDSARRWSFFMVFRLLSLWVVRLLVCKGGRGAMPGTPLMVAPLCYWPVTRNNFRPFSP
jgi:hypothetical protein